MERPRHHVLTFRLVLSTTFYLVRRPSFPSFISSYMTRFTVERLSSIGAISLTSEAWTKLEETTPLSVLDGECKVENLNFTPLPEKDPETVTCEQTLTRWLNRKKISLDTKGVYFFVEDARYSEDGRALLSAFIHSNREQDIRICSVVQGEPEPHPFLEVVQGALNIPDDDRARILKIHETMTLTRSGKSRAKLSIDNEDREVTIHGQTTRVMLGDTDLSKTRSVLLIRPAEVFALESSVRTEGGIELWLDPACERDDNGSIMSPRP